MYFVNILHSDCRVFSVASTMWVWNSMNVLRRATARTWSFSVRKKYDKTSNANSVYNVLLSKTTVCSKSFETVKFCTLRRLARIAKSVIWASTSSSWRFSTIGACSSCTCTVAICTIDPSRRHQRFLLLRQTDNWLRKCKIENSCTLSLLLCMNTFYDDAVSTRRTTKCTTRGQMCFRSRPMMLGR